MNVQRTAGVASVVLVAAAVAAGLFFSGAPSEQRLLRLDDRRALDLNRLSMAATARWNAGRGLAGHSAELVDGRSLSRIPVDPVADEPYEYRTTGPLAFEVCAVFDRPSRPELAGDFWFHEGGRQCFAFTVTERTGR
jgi:hypothetical protein